MLTNESYVSGAYRDIAKLLDSYESSLNVSMKFFYLYDKNAILKRISQAVSLGITDKY